MPRATVLMEPVQGKPSPVSLSHGKSHLCHLGMRAEAQAGKRNVTENQVLLLRVH